MLGILVSLAFTGLVFCLSMAVRVHHNSKAVLEILKTNPSAQTKYDQRFWRARRPISISAGNLFKIETPTFILSLFGEIILQNICNICLTFK
jgi:hypothetical protein